MPSEDDAARAADLAAEADAHDPGGLDLAAIIARQTTSAPIAQPVRSPRPRRRRVVDTSYSGPGADDRDPHLVGGALDDFIEERGWNAQIGVHLLVGRWSSLVGEVNAAHSQVVSFDGGVLVVQCDSTTWATSLRALASQLVAQLNRQLGDGTIRRVSVLGPNVPTWRHGRRSVRGRGPRDTYG